MEIKIKGAKDNEPFDKFVDECYNKMEKFMY